MNKGPNNPSHRGGGGRRRRRKHGGSNTQPGHQHHGQQGHPGHPGAQGGQHGRRSGRNRRGPAAFVGPMDHSYRTNLQVGPNSGNGASNRFRGGRGPGSAQFFQHPELEPLPQRDDVTRIFAFVEDLFFSTKIQETARKLNVKVEFVKSDKDILDRLPENGEAGGELPSLIIFDLNNVAAKPLVAIPKLKAKLKKNTSILGFLSHLQGDLKLKAQEAGCDAVMPRSAFSQNLPQLLRRHGAAEEENLA